MIAILPPAIQGLGNAGGFQLATEDRRNADLNALQQATDVVVAAANAEPGLAGVFTTYRSQVPQLYLNIDREKAERSATIMSIRQPSFKALRPQESVQARQSKGGKNMPRKFTWPVRV